MIRILIADDSETECQILEHILSQERDMKVIARAKNGQEAAELAARLKPDLITMDIHMPKVDGFEATRLIMTQTPIPIVVISSQLDSENNATFKALEAGALSAIKKPINIKSTRFKIECKQMVDTIRNMAQIKVIKKRFAVKQTTVVPPVDVPAKKNHEQFEIIAIGTSVGGPQALKTIFSNLPAKINVPIVVVQHMSPGFMTGFVKWLGNNIEHYKIKEAENEEELKPNVIYFAPDSYHLKIARNTEHLIAKLIKGPPVCGFCPSVSVLLNSVAHVAGEKALGILLTGMGNDGAQGLLEIKKAGGHTIIQDEKSAVVFGMAGVAKDLNAMDRIVELDKIADYIKRVVKKEEVIPS